MNIKPVILVRLRDYFLWFKSMHTFLAQLEGYACRISLMSGTVKSEKGSRA